MSKYPNLLKLFWGSAIAAELEYRFNFVIGVITSVGNLLGSLFGLFLFYRQGYQFQGWSWHQSLIVLAIFTILQGFSTTFLLNNLNKIVQQVQDGTLDFVLLKPVSSQFWLSTRTFSPWGLPDILLGLFLLGYAGSQLNLNWLNYLGGIIPFSAAIAIIYSLWFMLGTTSIWFVKIYNVTEVLRGLLEAGRYPITAYPVAYKFFFTFVVPVAFITTVPAETILGQGSLPWIISSILLAIALLFCSTKFWQFALRFYTSASS